MSANRSRPEEHARALHTITSLPLDPEFPLFRHYPAMKLGVRESVRFYASLLVPLAEEIVSSRPETTEWVMTAPPLYVIPAGANLVAWEVHRILGEPVRVVDLRYSRPSPQRAQDSLKGDDYSNSGVAERIRNRKALHEGEWAPNPDPSDFRDCAVLVINDINVTGTQQRFIRQTLETVHPASIDWLHVIEVDPALGLSNPEVEYSLNHLNLDSFEDFAEIVTRADIDYTSRCITRLFRYSEVMLAELFRSLEESRRRRLCELVTREGIYPGGNKAKLALLQESPGQRASPPEAFA